MFFRVLFITKIAYLRYGNIQVTVAKIKLKTTAKIVSSRKTRVKPKKPFKLAKIASLPIIRKRVRKAAAFMNPRGKRRDKAAIWQAKKPIDQLIIRRVHPAATPSKTRNSLTRSVVPEKTAKNHRISGKTKPAENPGQR